MNAAPIAIAIAGTVIAAIVDMRTGRIPNAVTRVTAALALAAAGCTGAEAGAALGAVTVGGTLFALYLLTLGAGIGLGDVKLGVAIGAGCGPLPGILALAAAFVAGGAYGAWLLATRRARRGAAIPFGPFLAAGTLLVGAGAVLAP
jgi:leader peptidase (prepilin peptidase) / N-methyltransferase